LAQGKEVMASIEKELGAELQSLLTEIEIKKQLFNDEMDKKIAELDERLKEIK